MRRRGAPPPPAPHMLCPAARADNDDRGRGGGSGSWLGRWGRFGRLGVATGAGDRAGEVWERLTFYLIKCHHS
jgi:hypothetical protein